MAKKLFSDKSEVNEFINDIKASAEYSREALEKLAKERNGITLMYEMKFCELGRDPLDPYQCRSLNIIEQLNQMFTYLVTVEALLLLLGKYKGKVFITNLGASNGYDIESADGEVVAEVFSATSPDSNGKLKKDVERMSKASAAKSRYVFYYAKNDKPVHVANLRTSFLDVNIVSVDIHKYMND